ncbi:iron transporter [Pelomonas sp. CA6]|uniref:iron transporter n=1 Tax=Pelomonas sp. CA6 TaxID=2907999 RepID=UPI001F4C1714|nr:iron transporter [Pelomonas sp. CA6]MCH7343387.1 iron transporter [Pelomonas sp. CA6]
MATPPNAPLPLRYRGAVLSRSLAALAGGYLLASALAAACALHLPLERVEATMTGTLLGNLAYALAVLGAFAARSAARAWVWTLGPAALLGLAVWAAPR